MERKSVLFANQKVVVVLGMHRSGTSALAGTLHHLGVGLGSSLMPADENNNPKGFWENEKIVEIHQRLLHDLRYTWHDVRFLPDNWLTRKDVRKKKDAITEIIAKEYSNYAVWGIKDPRICRLVPLWKEIFSEMGLKAVYVQIFRNPLEVAMSLKRRDGFIIDYSLLLWFLYNIEAVKNTTGDNRAFLEYEELLHDWPGSIENLGKKLDVHWPIKIDQAATEIGQFLSPDLYHNKSDLHTLVAREGISKHVITLYNLLRRASATGTAAIANPFEDFSEEYINAVNLLKPWLSILPKDMTRERIQQIEELDARLKEAQQLVEERNKYIGQLEPALAKAQKIVEQQNRKIANLQRDLKDNEQNMAQLALERMQRVRLLEEKLEETKQLAMQRIEQIDVLDAGLREANRFVEERNKYV
ncbi:MAG: hypothetical protein ACRERU_01915, partial [Methylococcales bacterium]